LQGGGEASVSKPYNISFITNMIYHINHLPFREEARPRSSSNARMKKRRSPGYASTGGRTWGAGGGGRGGRGREREGGGEGGGRGRSKDIRGSIFIITISTPLKYTSTQVHKYTSTQVHKYTSIQVHKYIEEPLKLTPTSSHTSSTFSLAPSSPSSAAVVSASACPFEATVFALPLVGQCHGRKNGLNI
jgi:hypothetical protein